MKRRSKSLKFTQIIAEIFLLSIRSFETRAIEFTRQTNGIVFMFCYVNEFGSKLASKREFVNLRPCRRFEKI